MLSVVIETFKKSVMLLCAPFANRCLVQSDWALYHLAQLTSQTRRDSPYAESPDRDSGSPDHRSVRNKEVKFIRIYSLGPIFSVRCPYQRESVIQTEVFLMKIYEIFFRTLETVRNREVSVPRGSTVQFSSLYGKFDVCPGDDLQTVVLSV